MRVAVTLPMGATQEDVVDYVTGAVKEYCGALQPPEFERGMLVAGDPMFALDPTSVHVTFDDARGSTTTTK